MSNVKYSSGDFTVARAVGALRNESPLLPELNDVLIFHQDFMQHADYFVRLDYNSINPDLLGNAAYLFNESPREDIGGKRVKWTRSWARIPNSYGKAGGIYPYPYPGFEDPTIQNGNPTDPVYLPAQLEIIRDFFLCGLGGQFNSWQQIPITYGFKVLDLNSGTIVSSVRDPDSSTGDPGTSPSLTEYRQMINNGTQLQAEDSKVTVWRGGIYMRENYLVLAQ